MRQSLRGTPKARDQTAQGLREQVPREHRWARLGDERWTGCPMEEDLREPGLRARGRRGRRSARQRDGVGGCPKAHPTGSLKAGVEECRRGPHSAEPDGER